MTSKEALEYLTSKVFTGGNSILETEAEICANVIKQDLERLKALEKENKKWREIVGCDLCEALGREILLEENEKLKKAVDWIKHTFEITLDSKVRISDGIDCIQAFPIDLKTNEVIYELLKEVLDNESNNT